MSIPYARASAGQQRAREEIKKVLRRFGCESIGFMDDYQKHEVLLAFTHRGRQVQLRASASGWAQLFQDAVDRDVTLPQRILLIVMLRAAAARAPRLLFE